MKVQRLCPVCAKPVHYVKGQALSKEFPFCSERCRLIDLGAWIDEDYRVSEELPSSDSGRPADEEPS